jgi:hypothetical protein
MAEQATMRSWATVFRCVSNGNAARHCRRITCNFGRRSVLRSSQRRGNEPFAGGCKGIYLPRVGVGWGASERRLASMLGLHRRASPGDYRPPLQHCLVEWLRQLAPCGHAGQCSPLRIPPGSIQVPVLGEPYDPHVDFNGYEHPMRIFGRQLALRHADPARNPVVRRSMIYRMFHRLNRALDISLEDPGAVPHYRGDVRERRVDFRRYPTPSGLWCCPDCYCERA